MVIQAIVWSRRKRKMKIGRGFSRKELEAVGLTFKEALSMGIPIDTRRKTYYEENVGTLKKFIEKIKEIE